MDTQKVAPKEEEEKKTESAGNADVSVTDDEIKTDTKAELEPDKIAEKEDKEQPEETKSREAKSENSDAEAEDVRRDEPKAEETKPAISNAPADARPEESGAKWYIVHTYSGHEDRVTKTLRQRIQSLGFEDRIFDIIVPKRNTVKVSGGKKESIKEKIFPGYIIVRMLLDNESWLLVRTTQGVTSFIGTGNKPTPISEKEVEAIQKFMNMEEPLYKTAFAKGEAIKIVDGPFADFLGTIDEIDEAKGRLKVLVSIFGRETPVELDFLQVTKL